jgi:hypothetical protein
VVQWIAAPMTAVGAGASPGLKQAHFHKRKGSPLAASPAKKVNKISTCENQFFAALPGGKLIGVVVAFAIMFCCSYCIGSGLKARAQDTPAAKVAAPAVPAPAAPAGQAPKDASTPAATPAAPADAAAASAPPNRPYVNPINTMWVLITEFLVFFVRAGFIPEKRSEDGISRFANESGGRNALPQDDLFDSSFSDCQFRGKLHPGAMMSARRTAVLFWVLVAMANASRSDASAADFQQGDEVRLTKDAQLSFKSQPYREGKAGEIFPVLQMQPASQKVFLLATGPDRNAIAVSVDENALERAFPAKFSPEEAALLAAASGRYILNGKVVDPPANRAEIMATNVASPDVVVKKIAGQMGALDELLHAVGEIPEKRADELRKFGGEWRGFVAEGFWSALTGREQSNGDLVSRTEDLMKGVQEQQTQELYLECLCAEIPNSLRQSLSTLAARKNVAPANGRIPVAISALVDPMGLWIQIENRGAYTLNHSMITGRRLQDEQRVNAMNKDRMIAGGLMTLFGFSGQATAANDLVSRLGIHTYGMETGGFAYVPALPSRSVMRFPVSSLKGLGYTQRVEASVWCDEGAVLDEPAANLDGALKAYQVAQAQAQKRAAEARANSRAPASAPSNQPSTANSNHGLAPQNRGGLQPSTGLQPSKGL